MAEETHKAIRNFLADMFGAEVAEEITIQYGGSMKPENAAELYGSDRYRRRTCRRSIIRSF